MGPTKTALAPKRANFFDEVINYRQTDRKIILHHIRGCVDFSSSIAEIRTQDLPVASHWANHWAMITEWHSVSFKIWNTHTHILSKLAWDIATGYGYFCWIFRLNQNSLHKNTNLENWNVSVVFSLMLHYYHLTQKNLSRIIFYSNNKYVF